MRLVLGSASPRRRELLAQIGVVPDDIRGADIDETPLRGELPRVYVERMAREKCAAIDADGLVLTADTTVSVGRRILGKPEDAAEATQFLLLMSGRRHRVITSVCVRRGETLHQRTVETRVNGELRQSDTTASMAFPFARIIEYVSTFTELGAGDLIATGTPTGAGARFDPPIWLKPGDEVEVSVPGVGVLRNPIAEETL